MQAASSREFVTRAIDLSKYLTQPEITIISGVRRSGKSALLERLLLRPEWISKAIYINFEDPRLTDFVVEDFQNVYESWLEDLGSDKNTHSTPRLALFDEVQNVLGWEPWMNFFSKQKHFKVFATGSNSNMLSAELGSHLTGRHHEVTLFPLSFGEILTHYNDTNGETLDLNGGTKTLIAEQRMKLQNLLVAYLKFGGFPRSWLGQDTGILAQYYQQIIQRDIVKRKKLRNSLPLERVGQGLMADIGRKIGKQKLARVVGLKDGDTVDRYIKYFQECFLGFEIHKFDRSIRRQLTNQSKFYAIDPAMARRVTPPSAGKEGFFLENLVLVELFRRKYKSYYGETKEKAEVDFVSESENGVIDLFQVAWSVDDPGTFEREIAGIELFTSEYRDMHFGKKYLLTVEPCPFECPNEIEAVTFYQWACRSDPA